MTDSILLIHDDSTLLRSIGARFEQAGCEVLRELTGEAGVTTLERSRPDVVCLAMHLAEASPALVGRLAGYEAPVIGFGEKVSAEATAGALVAGASQVADLSVDPDLLFNLAQKAGAEGRRNRAAEAVIRAGSPRFGADSLGGSAPMRQLANQLGLLAQSERTTVLDECLSYSDELRKNGQLVAEEPLQPANTAVTVCWTNGKVAVTDGPYAETKEHLGGIQVLDARDLNHAIQVISQHPGVKWKCGTVEIRPAADPTK